MNIQTVQPEDVLPGRQIEFKRGPGKGRPALGKALSVGEQNLIVMLNDGALDRIRMDEVRKVIKHRGRPAVSELERFAAIGYAKSNPVSKERQLETA
jgi:hypothetical protein